MLVTSFAVASSFGMFAPFFAVGQLGLFAIQVGFARLLPHSLTHLLASTHPPTHPPIASNPSGLLALLPACALARLQTPSLLHLTFMLLCFCMQTRCHLLTGISMMSLPTTGTIVKH